MQRSRGGVARKKNTRQRVLKVAAELFATRGYAATSISAIRKASGVLPSSIYWEFGNKAGIFAAVLEDSAERWLKQSSQAVIKATRDHRDSSVNPLAVYFDYMAEALAEGPEFLRLMFMVALEQRNADPRALEIVRSHRARSIEAVARIFAVCGLEQPGPDGVATHDIARLMIACFDGAFAAGQLDADEAEVRRMFTLLYSAMAAALQSTQALKPE